MGAPIRVLILYHDEATRRAMRVGLDGVSDILIVGEAPGDQALAHIQSLQPDVILWAINAADLPAIGQVQQGRIIVLAAADQGPLVLEALRAGAVGHLNWEAARPEQLSAAVRAVSRGEAVLSPLVAGWVLDQVLERWRRRET